MSEGPAKVAYLGASVTRQRNGYRPRLHQLLEARHGRELGMVNAGLGAMDAVSIAFFTDEFVTAHEPDLCFVDVTSCGLTEARTIEDGRAALDGILAKLRGAGCTPCVLHLPRRERSDRFDALIEAYEDVAGAHGSAQINLAEAFPDAGELLRDEVHTTEAGSAAYAAAIDEAAPPIDGSPGGDPPLPAAPEPSYRDARHVPVAAADGGTEGRFRLAWQVADVAPGAAIRKSFAGRLEGLALVIGPGSGDLEVIDAAGRQGVTVKDRWAGYDRYGAVVFERRLKPGEVSIVPGDGQLRLIGYLELP